jgi:hypothetical protein
MRTSTGSPVRIHRQHRLPTAEIPNVFVNTAEKRDELPPLHVLL